MTASHQIIGIDLSLTRTGIATIHGCASLKSPSTGMQRLAFYRDLILASAVRCTLAVVEGYSMGGQRGSAGIGQALGELGGVVRLALWEQGIDYIDVPPSTLKKFATGKGNSDKDGVLIAAINAGGEPKNHDEADAWWLRQLGLYAHRSAEVPHTTYRDDVSDAIAWPGGTA